MTVWIITFYLRTKNRRSRNGTHLVIELLLEIDFSSS